MELFDTHCHLFEHGFHGSTGVLVRGRGRELEEYERFREEYRIAKSLVVGYDGDGYAGNSEYVAGLAETRDWVVPLRYATGSDLDFARSPAGWGYASRAPGILSLNASPEALAELEPSIRAADDTWVLISHLGLPGPVASEAAARERLEPLLRLAGLPHVSVKLSGQYAASTSGYPHDDARVLVDIVAEVFGTAALVWGSDFSPCLEFVSLEEAVECLLPAGASAAERHDILFGNADRSFHQYAGALR